MGNKYYVKMKIVPFKDSDLEMIRDAMRQERHLKNEMMSRYAIKYFEYGKDMETLEREIFQIIQFKNPYIKAFTNPMLDKELASYRTQLDLRRAHNHGLGTGDRSLPTYKTDNTLSVKSEELKFSNKYGDQISEKYKDKDFEVILMIDKSPFGPKVYFKVVFGSPKSSMRLRNSIKNVILGHDKRVASSKLQIKNNDLYLVMTLSRKIPELIHPTGIVVGVDIGVSVPAACAINTNEYVRSFIGDSHTISVYRKRIAYRRNRIKHELSIARGGHGKKRKFESIKHSNLTVGSFITTYNHKIAKDVIRFAISHNADQINLEKLDMKTGEKNYTNQILKVMEYKQLQTFIEQKARDNGLKVRYVVPAYTSSTCSRCGFINKSNRISQKQFHCLNCGFKANADFNAARNISMKESIEAPASV